MSAKPPKYGIASHIKCFTAWGLAPGEHAFYAESLGQLYLFLAGAFLGHLGNDDIEDAMILNFHVGLNCKGTYDLITARGVMKKRAFKVSLTNPLGGIVQRIASLRKPTGRFTLAVCSAAVLSESFRLAKPAMKKFMVRDYSRIKNDAEFELAVAKRLAHLTRDFPQLDLRVFHTAADLPLTAVYLKFSKPVHPFSPTGKVLNRRNSNGICELLATGLYEPRYATDVVQERSDVNLPVQILVASDAPGHSRVRTQIESLKNVYAKHIKLNAELPSHPDIDFDYHTVNFFVVHYGEDRKLAGELKKQIEGFGARKGLNCKCIVGIGQEMSKSGQSFYENFHELTQVIDYAIVLYPLKSTKRHNVLYELGVFSQRFVTWDSSSKRNSSRATLVGKNSKIVKELSDWSGIPHINRPKGSAATAAKQLFKDLATKIPLFRP